MDTQQRREREIARLGEKELKLHGLALHEPHYGKKLEYQREMSKLHTKRVHLESERRLEREEEANIKLKNLLTNQKQRFKIEVNGRKIEIPEDLKVSIPFTPCGHTEKTDVSEVLRNGNQTNRWLLSTWRSIIHTNAITSTAINCQKCRQEKAERKEKFGRIRATPIGKARITIRHLH